MLSAKKESLLIPWRSCRDAGPAPHLAVCLDGAETLFTTDNQDATGGLIIRL